MITLAIVALLPLILIFILTLWYRMPSHKTLAYAWALTMIIGLFYWQIPGDVIIGAGIKGVMIAIDIMFIILGAIILLRLLQSAGAIKSIDAALCSISKDRRIQAIIICWSFGAFLEGAAGFGTPGALAASLLVSIGFSPLIAVTMSVIAGSSPVTFGAAGTPILLGIQTILPTGSGIPIQQIVVNTAIIHAIIGTFTPLILILLLTHHYRSWRDSIDLLPYCLMAGLTFTIPYYLIARYYSPELPTIVGSLIGLALIIILTKKKFLVPQKTWQFPGKKPTLHFNTKMSTIKSMLPYILVAILLVLTRMPAIGDVLKSYALIIPTSAGEYTLAPLYSPGFLMIITILFAIWLYGLHPREIKAAIESSGHRLAKATIALVFIAATVQIIISSSQNNSGLPSMPQIIGGLFGGTGMVYLLFAPILGALGAIIAGSNTVSNFLFVPIQLETAKMIGLAPALVLALQTSGGAIGNILALQNIIVSSAAAGIHGKESEVMKSGAIPCILSAIAAGLIGIAIWYTG